MKRIWDLIVIGISSLLVALSFNWLLIPHQLLSGGLSGISMMIGYLTGWNISIVFFIANLPIIVWGLIKIGRTFIVYSVAAVILTAWFMQLVPIRPLVSEPLLAAVFGGVMVGVATGAALRVGGSTGGFDIVGSIVTRSRDFPLGMFLFGINGIIVVALGYFKNNWDLALTSMLCMYITGKVVDIIHIRHIKITAFIVTRHQEDIMKRLLGMPRGVTVLKAEGGYYRQEQAMLMVVTTRYELAELKKIVREYDPHAFVNIVETVGVIGEFRR